jgi:glycosyltransferase involved in cell wall biosynthesis
MSNNLSNFLRPLVSIAVPVYNGEKFIGECLESIERQTYQNWECIINDNCSTDNTVRIVESYVRRDPRFKIHRNEAFVDITENWNMAFQRISKDAVFCKIMPADDWIFADFLEKMVNIMKDHPNIGFCSSYRIDDVKVKCDNLDIYQGNVFEGKKILLKQLKQQIEVTGSANTVLYRHDTLKRLPYYPHIFMDDFVNIDTILAYDLLSISDIGFVYQVLSYTRRHNESLTNNVIKKYNTFLSFKLMTIKRYMHLFPELERLYKRVRLDYAYYLLGLRLRADRKTLQWHHSHTNGQIMPAETLLAAFTRNILARQIDKITKRTIHKPIFAR